MAWSGAAASRMLALTSVETIGRRTRAAPHVSGPENWSQVGMGDVAVPRDRSVRLPSRLRHDHLPRLRHDPFEQGSQDSRAGIATGEHGARPAQIGGAFPPPLGNDGGP